MRYLLAVLLLLSTPAWAESVKYGETDNSHDYYDPATISVNGNFRRVWQVQDLKQRHKDGELSRRYLLEYDCKEERAKTLFFSTFSGQMLTGETLQSGSDPGGWDYIPHGTVGETMLKIVCK